MRFDKTRLKWSRSPDGKVKSEEVLAGADIVFAVIDTTQDPISFEITDGQTVFGTGKKETLRKAKQQAKALLKQLNSRFIDEVRPKPKRSRV